MFENTNPLPGQLPPTPPPMPNMPMGSAPIGAPPMGQPPVPPQAKVFTMPEKFRSVGGGGSKSGGSGNTKRLMIILIVVVVVAGLTVGGLYVFNNVLKKNTNNDNANLVVNTVGNQNLNSGANTNTVNTNTVNTNATNDNTNVANTNDNTNTASNTNTVTNANTNTTTNTNTSTVISGPLPSSADTDVDGLTDIEEVVYGTDPAKPDTDGDSFIDGKKAETAGTIGELFNGYNPAGTGRLEGSTLVKRQENSTQVYSILVPTPWSAVTDSSGGLLISPSQSTGELFQVRLDTNPNKLSPTDWYLAANPAAKADELTPITVNALEGIYSEDQSTVYFFHDTKVYLIQYSTGTLTQVNYRTTFDMMVRSFKLVATS